MIPFSSSFWRNGHTMLGIRVKRESNQFKNILFPLALLRFIVKALLVWISLLTVSGNDKRKTIHDYLVGSVVVHSGALFYKYLIPSELFKVLI